MKTAMKFGITAVVLLCGASIDSFSSPVEKPVGIDMAAIVDYASQWAQQPVRIDPMQAQAPISMGQIFALAAR